MNALERIRDMALGQRQNFIVQTFETHFGGLMRARPDAWRAKFRKMAAGAFAFYRGSAILFYSDLQGDVDSYLTPRSARVWIQGNLHAENFGTYQDSTGRLVFDVNDFAEAYVAPFTWDLRRFVASVALIGDEKALSDSEIRELMLTFGRGYLQQVHRFAEGADSSSFAMTLENAEGAIRDILRTARLLTRVDLLNADTEIADYDRRFRRGGKRLELDAPTRARLEDAYMAYLVTIPRRKRQSGMNYQIKDAMAAEGFEAFWILLEGPTQTLENDIIVAMTVARPSAASAVVNDPSIFGYFLHEGHRTALAQRALQAHSDPWLGYTSFDGQGMFVAEVSPYAARLDWSGINRLDDLRRLAADLGRAVAKIHCLSDEVSDRMPAIGSVSQAIEESLAGREEAFVRDLASWGESYGAIVRDDHRLFVDAFRNRRFAFLSD